MKKARSILSNLQKELEEAISNLKKELATLHVSIASPEMIEDIKVSYMGSKTPIKSLASISVLDPTTLKIDSWDKSVTQEIEKSLSNSALSLSVSVQGKSIFAKLPPMSQERRKSIIRIFAEKAEQARARIRLIRDHSWKEIQKLQKEKLIGEDEKFRAKDEMEKIVKKANEDLENFKNLKEKEILTS